MQLTKAEVRQLVTYVFWAQQRMSRDVATAQDNDAHKKIVRYVQELLVNTEETVDKEAK